MSTAVAEKPTTIAAPPRNGKALSSKLQPRSFDEVAQEVSAITQQPIETAANLVIATVPQTDWKYQQGKLILPATATRDALAAMVERLNEAIAGMSSTTPAPEAIEPVSANGIAPAPTPEAIEPPAEPVAKPARKPRSATAAAKKPAAKKTTATKKPAGTRARKAKDTAE